MIQNMVTKNTTRGYEVDVGCGLAPDERIPLVETDHPARFV
jgi:hypothetical protein